MSKKASQTNIKEPPISQFLFGDTKMSLFWLLVRLYVGWQWIQAGWEKITSSVWTGNEAGKALHGFILGALEKANGPHADVSSWYANFLNNYVLIHASLFSHIVSYGEFLVGVALILGIFTGIAAFFWRFYEYELSFCWNSKRQSHPFFTRTSLNPCMANCWMVGD